MTWARLRRKPRTSRRLRKFYGNNPREFRSACEPCLCHEFAPVPKTQLCFLIQALSCGWPCWPYRLPFLQGRGIFPLYHRQRRGGGVETSHEKGHVQWFARLPVLLNAFMPDHRSTRSSCTTPGASRRSETYPRRVSCQWGRHRQATSVVVVPLACRISPSTGTTPATPTRGAQNAGHLHARRVRGRR